MDRIHATHNDKCFMNFNRQTFILTKINTIKTLWNYFARK